MCSVEEKTGKRRRPCDQCHTEAEAISVLVCVCSFRLLGMVSHKGFRFTVPKQKRSTISCIDDSTINCHQFRSSLATNYHWWLFLLQTPWDSQSRNGLVFRQGHKYFDGAMLSVPLFDVLWLRRCLSTSTDVIYNISRQQLFFFFFFFLIKPDSTN